MMENRSWLITPWHQLELVHAVQQPLIEPRWNRFEVTRGPESLSADLFGEVVLDASSTEKVDLVADWSETVDDLAQPGPEVRQAHAHVFELPLKVAAQGRTDIDPHEVACSLRHDHLLTFFTAVRQRELPGPNPHVFGDTHYRRIKYQIVATSAFREDFPPDWAKRPDLLSRTSLPQEVDVLCSSPPATPKVLYVVPTLGWTTSAADGATVRHRRGGGLRVYLERPWFSSGDGELLGVVVGGLTSPIADDYHLITLLGQDPIRDGAPLAFATPARFRNATLVAESIEPLELRQPVAVVAYTPAYDPDTRRWFCDLELDTLDAYMPFVRLALARYQPHAQVGCALSRIALADIVQTTPDRALTVTREGEELQITVAGVSYTAIHSMGAPRSDDAALARMVARLEHRDASIPDEFLGWQAVDGAEVVLTRALAGIAATWTGRLPLPPGDGGARRLTVVEEEYFAIDEQTPGKGNLGARVVYADTLEI
jgi:hypothetical protein